MASVRSLYIVRHAIAAERGDKWPDDSKRPLTHKGVVRMRFGVRGLEALGVEIDLVVTSPLVRAVETAEILVRGLRTHPTMIKTAALAPGGSPAGVAEALASHTKSRGIALVGHEPDLGELAAWLIGSRTPLPLKKGGVCRVDVTDWPPRHGTLIWFATPKMLRCLD